MSNEVYETPEGSIRCPTSNRGSVLELSASGTSVLKRYVRPDGTPYGDHAGDWRVLRADEVRSYSKWPQLRAWFVKHGFNEALLGDQEAAETEATAKWKKDLTR